jgi:hypothetical protein
MGRDVHLFQFLTADPSSSMDPLDLHCTHSAMANAYSFFVTNNVRTTWEPWGCEGAVTTNDALVEDWHAREANITVVKSAGDGATPDCGDCDTCDGREKAWGCMASNSLCVGSITSTNTLGPQSDRNITDDNSPAFPPDTCYSDREDPDVLALGTAVQVMGFGSTTDWSPTKNGTSFSAPTMAALASLLKQECGTNIAPLRERAIIMTSAWSLDAGQPFPKLGTIAFGNPIDFLGGTGAPTADHAGLWCGGTSGELTIGDAPVSIDYGSGTTADTGMDMPTQTKSVSDFKYFVVTSQSLSVGDRIRATLTWNTCADGAHTPTITGSDLDLWLCKATTPSTSSPSRARS